MRLHRGWSAPAPAAACALVAFAVLAAGCWSERNPYDPTLCASGCPIGQRCLSGRCVPAADSGVDASGDAPRDVSAETRVDTVTDTGRADLDAATRDSSGADGPRADGLRPDGPRPDAALPDAPVADAPLPDSGPSCPLSAEAGAWVEGFALHQSGSSYYGVIAVAYDPATGKRYVAGTYGGQPTIAGKAVPRSQGFSDVFVARLSPGGVADWVAVAGGANSEQATSLAIDGSGNAYLGGYYSSVTTIAGKTLRANAGAGTSIDAFVAKVDSGGAFVWATGGGGGLSDQVNAVAADSAGVYATGRFRNHGRFGSVDLGNASDNRRRLFILRLDPGTGAVVWARALANSGNTAAGNALTLGGGALIVTGYYSGSLTIGGAAALPVPAAYSLFVATVNVANGAFVWGNAPKLSTLSEGLAVAWDPQLKAIWIGGRFEGQLQTDLPFPLNAQAKDAVLLLQTMSTKQLSGWQLAGAKDDQINAVSVSGSDVFVSGFFVGALKVGGTTLNASSPTVSARFIARYGAGKFDCGRVVP